MTAKTAKDHPSAWTATAINGTVGAAVLATPAAVTTTATFPNDGEWQITLVVTDANLNTATVTKLISVDRYITVNGPTTEINGSWFGSLQAAYDWITANDAANDSLYLIDVFGVTTDAATITPNQARVHFQDNALVTVGFNLGAGIYRFSGNQIEQANIVLAGGIGFTLAAGTTLEISNLGIVNNAGIGIFSPGGHTSLLLRSVSIIGASIACIFIRGAGFSRIQDCYFQSNSSAGNNPVNLFNGCTVEMYDTVIKGGPDSYGLAIGTPGLAGVIFRGKGIYAECPGGTVNSRCPIEIVVQAGADVEITDFTAIARGATGNAAFAYMALRIRGIAAGKCLLSNGTIYATSGITPALWLQTPALAGVNLNILNCDIRSEGGNSIVSSTGVSTIVASAWNPANLVECSIHGPFAGGPITPIAAVLSGGNYTY